MATEMAEKVTKGLYPREAAQTGGPIIGGHGDPIAQYDDFPRSGLIDGKQADRPWAYSSQTPSETNRDLSSSMQRCDRDTCSQRVCCRDLVGEDERTLIDPDVVRDIIIGLSDGLTVPFGLTAGLSSLGSSQLVVVAGLAELISGAISMGIGGYLASEAERDHFRYRQEVLRNRVTRSCPGEMERQVQGILGPVGIRPSLCRDITRDLLSSEKASRESTIQDDTFESSKNGLLRKILQKVARKPKVYDAIAIEDAMLHAHESNQPSALEPETEGSGMTDFLLRFGEGMEEVPTIRLYISAFTIGTAYFLGGLIPMAPYFFVEKANVALMWSIGVMFLTLLFFGALKAYFTGARIGMIGYLKGSLSTIVVGGGAAAASYVVVRLLGTEAK